MVMDTWTWTWTLYYVTTDFGLMQICVVAVVLHTKHHHSKESSSQNRDSTRFVHIHSTYRFSTVSN